MPENVDDSESTTETSRQNDSSSGHVSIDQISSQQNDQQELPLSTDQQAEKEQAEEEESTENASIQNTNEEEYRQHDTSFQAYHSPSVDNEQDSYNMRDDNEQNIEETTPLQIMSQVAIDIIAAEKNVQQVQERQEIQNIPRRRTMLDQLSKTKEALLYVLKYCTENNDKQLKTKAEQRKNIISKTTRNLLEISKRKEALLTVIENSNQKNEELKEENNMLKEEEMRSRKYIEHILENNSALQKRNDEQATEILILKESNEAQELKRQNEELQSQILQLKESKETAELQRKIEELQSELLIMTESKEQAENKLKAALNKKSPEKIEEPAQQMPPSDEEKQRSMIKNLKEKKRTLKEDSDFTYQKRNVKQKKTAKSTSTYKSRMTQMVKKALSEEDKKKIDVINNSASKE